MNDVKKRHDLIINKVSMIKDVIVKNDSGEIYITWKGSTMKVKFARYLDPENLEQLDK